MSKPRANLTVRPAAIDNASLVRKLMLIAFESLRDLDPPSSAFGETEADVAAAIARGGAAIAYLGDEPVGSVRFEPQETWLYIARLAVTPPARRQGVAAALMGAAEAEAPHFGLHEAQVEMRSHLGGNRALFTSLGYELVWERPHPRNPAFTTVRMRKPLP
ncbi:MAG TPA: GNAT family N-acetyltransferase [Thermomicrobiales bacterium]|nr:GNAT family N-acetyltransferase [Thermomicrobiales bacterium]